MKSGAVVEGDRRSGQRNDTRQSFHTRNLNEIERDWHGDVWMEPEEREQPIPFLFLEG
jgi:hypothetical protein